MLGRSTARTGEILTDLVKRSLAVGATAAGDRAPRLRLLETVRAAATGTSVRRSGHDCTNGSTSGAASGRHRDTFLAMHSPSPR